MENHDFIKNFKEQLEDPTIQDISIDTPFRLIPTWDSLTGMAVQMMIKDKYDAFIPDEEFKKAITINDLYNLMIKYQTK